MFGNTSGWRRMMSRGVLALAGLIVVAFVGFGLMFWIGGNDVNHFCEDAVPGFPADQLAALAKKHRVRLSQGPRDASGAHLLLAHTPRSYARHTCLVRYDKNAVIDRQVGYAD